MRPTLHVPVLLPLLLGLVLVAAPGCGAGGYYFDDTLYPSGSVEVDNLSLEYTMGFYLAPSYSGLFTGNLLGAPLPPGFIEYVGEFDEDWYDAEADMEFGDLVQWFDVFVPAYETTIFEVY